MKQEALHCSECGDGPCKYAMKKANRIQVTKATCLVPKTRKLIPVGE